MVQKNHFIQVAAFFCDLILLTGHQQNQHEQLLSTGYKLSKALFPHITDFVRN